MQRRLPRERRRLLPLRWRRRLLQYRRLPRALRIKDLLLARDLMSCRPLNPPWPTLPRRLPLGCRRGEVLLAGLRLRRSVCRLRPVRGRGRHKCPHWRLRRWGPARPVPPGALASAGVEWRSHKNLPLRARPSVRPLGDPCAKSTWERGSGGNGIARRSPIFTARARLAIGLRTRGCKWNKQVR